MSIYCHVIEFLIENDDIIDIVICSVLVCDQIFLTVFYDFCSIPKKKKRKSKKNRAPVSFTIPHATDKNIRLFRLSFTLIPTVSFLFVCPF